MLPPELAALGGQWDKCLGGDMAEDKSMAPGLPFLKDGVFDPTDIQAMSMALDDVCKRLNLGEDLEREVIAERIANLARGGVRNPTVLRDRVLHEAGQAEQVGLSAGHRRTA